MKKTQTKSRQVKWQQAKRAAGLCPKCGQETGGRYYCEYHRQMEHEKYLRRKMRRQRKGIK